MLRANITGVVVKRVFAPTLDLARRLHPETRHVFVVGGVSPFDRRLQASVRHALRPYEDRVVVTYLTGLTMDGTVRAWPSPATQRGAVR
jgi:hypothetical protein